MNRFVLLLTVLAFVCIQFEIANAVCCHRRGSLIGCCGRGPCNIFCCNCDRGCNPHCYNSFEGNRKYGVSSVDAAQRFELINQDSNDYIDVDEAHAYLNQERKNGEVPKWFTDMDADKNGFISRGEFDKSMA